MPTSMTECILVKPKNLWLSMIELDILKLERSINLTIRLIVKFTKYYQASRSKILLFYNIVLTISISILVEFIKLLFIFTSREH